MDSAPITIQEIQTWQILTNDKYSLLPTKFKCAKWYKWFNNGEEPYPCVCPIKNDECIELELYYELQKVINVYNQEDYFKQAIEEFELIDKQNNTALFSWVKRHKTIGSQLFFTPTISILRDPEKNDKLIIQLNPDEFSTVIQFQEIFNTVYYSEEFQTNIIH